MKRAGHDSGMVFTFGKEDHGKLGHGRSSAALAAAAAAGSGAPQSGGGQGASRLQPVVVEQLRFVGTIAVASLSTHSLAVSEAGDLYSWGNGDRFRLGHGSSRQEELPRLVRTVPPQTRICDVACGLGHTVVLSRSGSVFAWGNGANGRLGNGAPDDQPLPVQVLFAASGNSAASGASGSTAAGALRSTSGGGGGAEGGGADDSSSNVAPPRVVKIFCGASHSLAIDHLGRAFAWGKNNQGQCGLGNRTDAFEPRSITALASEVVVDMAGGWEHSLACSQRGRAFAFGAGYKDKRSSVSVPPVLGILPVPERCLLPQQIEHSFLNLWVASVHCGWDHSMAITDAGKLCVVLDYLSVCVCVFHRVESVFVRELGRTTRLSVSGALCPHRPRHRLPACLVRCCRCLSNFQLNVFACVRQVHLGGWPQWKTRPRNRRPRPCASAGPCTGKVPCGVCRRRL